MLQLCCSLRRCVQIQNPPLRRIQPWQHMQCLHPNLSESKWGMHKAIEDNVCEFWPQLCDLEVWHVHPVQIRLWVLSRILHGTEADKSRRAGSRGGSNSNVNWVWFILYFDKFLFLEYSGGYWGTGANTGDIYQRFQNISRLSTSTSRISKEKVFVA